MNIDVRGKIANTNLPASRPLLPLFDAIVNSIDAIEDRGQAGGRITATVVRDTAQQLLQPDGPDLRPVIGFRIEDDGIGFTDENYKSFDTAESTMKRPRGGKGVGRFLWLKAFSAVHVDSWFSENGPAASARRTFRFRLPDGISDHKLERVPTPDGHRTVIELSGFLEPWATECPKGLDVIANRILDHCAGFFLRGNCPAILLCDDSAQVSLNDRFAAEYAVEPSVTFVVKENAFHVRHLKIRDPQQRHRFYLCANTRQVTPHPMSLPDLPRRLFHRNGDGYVLASYITGPALDASVNPERTRFSLPDTPGESLTDVSIQEILDGAIETLKAQLAAELNAAAEQRRRRLEEYTESKAPEYRVLVKHYPERLRSIPVDASDDRLEHDLHRVKHELEQEARAEVGQLLKVVESVDDYEARLAELLGKVTELGKSDLIKYVAHRRLVLQLLEKTLKQRGSGKYSPESEVHRIIFPLRATSDDERFNEQNLWLVDERLAYHRYLASDLPLSPEERTRPDVAIYDRPLAFGDQEIVGGLTLIEFKRPMRQAYAEDENPFDQVYGYVEKIRAGKAQRQDGRPLRVADTAPIYAWVVCDFMPAIERYARRASLVETPDKQGFYGWNPELRAYVEVISYDKLLSDGQKRNRAFFERLQIT
jgi:hypothetical protein